MSRYHSYIASAVKIIGSYAAGKPLNLHLKNFFSSDKKYGSGDRKAISDLVYNYYRTGNAFVKEVEEKILLSTFLCSEVDSPLLQLIRPDLNSKIDLPLSAKLEIAGIKEEDIFSFWNELGASIDAGSYARSMLVQPNVFIRVRPRKKDIVLQKFAHHNITYNQLEDDAIELPAKVDISKIIAVNEEAVIQDLNSQKVLDFLDTPDLLSPVINAWDCCAASGGKSILLYDKLDGNVNLTVSDIRESILQNLKLRLKQARVPVSKSFVADLSGSLEADQKFSIIICDAPCTGSGTWSRTPEQLFFFHAKKIHGYTLKQQEIISATIPHLQENGLYFYITCSVFKKENEEVVAFAQAKHNLKILHMEYLEGYENKADTMFVAVMQPNI